MVNYTEAKKLLKTGDIILFSGNRLHEKFIQWGTRSPWNHVEAIFMLFGHLFSIGAYPRGVMVHRLSMSIQDHPGKNLVIRPMWKDRLFQNQNQMFIEQVFNHVGEGYDFTGVEAFLARKFIPGTSWKQEGHVFCSELIALGLDGAKYKWNGSSLPPEDVPPGMFDNREFFEVICSIDEVAGDTL